jgi:hypothetical protein
MPISAAYESSATIGTTLYSLPNASTTLTPIIVDGVYQVFIDFAAMTIADQYEVTIYEKVTSAGSQRMLYQSVITGASTPAWVSPSLILLHGWDVQVRKLSGTDRSIGWSIRQVA